MTAVWFTLLVLSTLASIMLGVLLVSIFRAGKHGFDEARQLQGTVRHVWEGTVGSEFDISNDPRLIEGMEGEANSKRFHHQNRTSDDYLKSIFGA